MINRGIPEELITDILWRLPTGGECIGRFRCVCKSWRALLSDPSFILREESAASRNEIMINFRKNNKGGSVYSFRSAETLDPLFPASPVQLLPCNSENPPEFDTDIIAVAGSCNGLICISDGHYDLILWNPATSETKVLPRSRLSFHWKLGAVGLGFDPVTDDYKIVSQFEYDDGSWGVTYTKKVYSLRDDSWTELADRDDGYNPILPWRQIPQLHKGKLYWPKWGGYPNWKMDWETVSELLFDSFDMSSHEFQKVELPCPNSGNNGYSGWGCSCLLNEESMVALFPLYYDDTDHHEKQYYYYPASWEIWVLQKYWVPESWIKVRVITSRPAGMVIPCSIGISRNLKCLLFIASRRSTLTGKYHDFYYCDKSLVTFHLEEGKFSDLDFEIEAISMPIMMNYMPSQVCMRDYYMSPW